MPSEHDRIAAAASRLRGLLVETPLIGGALLAGWPAMPELRIKPECLQPGGSIWFRGAMHALARQMGAAAGIVAQGGSRQVLATVVAAQAQRVPVFACPADDVVGEALLVAAGARAVERCPDVAAAAAAAERLRLRSGYRLAAQPGDPDFDDGIATAGRELAGQLPRDVELVAVSPGELAPALRRGLEGAAERINVVGLGAEAEPEAEELASLAQALREGARLCSDRQGLLALHAALSGRLGSAPCVVLSC